MVILFSPHLILGEPGGEVKRRQRDASARGVHPRAGLL